MYKVQVLVVEDDLIIAGHIKAILEDFGYLVNDVFSNGENALEYLRKNTVDIILMDVSLAGELDGIETAREIQKTYQIPIIFLTANSDQATFNRAKETLPVGFVSKPFKNLDLIRNIEIILNKINSEVDRSPQKAEESLLNDRIFVRDKNRMVKLNIDEILYVQAERNYCKVTTREKSYTLSIPLAKFEEKVSSTIFTRIHRSHTVNIKAIDELNDNYVFINGQSFAISKSHKDELNRRLTLV